MCKGFAQYKRRIEGWIRQANTKPPYSLIIVLSISIFLTSCQLSSERQSVRSWTYADLHALDPVDSSDPHHDLVAIYSRTTDTNLEIRIDFLDLQTEPDYDLYLVLDYQSGGTNALPLDTSADILWDMLVDVSKAGPPQVRSSDLNTNPTIIPRVLRDPLLDTVELQFNRKVIQGIGKNITIQVFLTAPSTPDVIDVLGPVQTDTPPPPRVPLLLAFWNTFPAYTPAQALRRWDGAHSGPFGERHGLRHLIQNAQHFQVPIVLLDLKSPFALSALEYLDVITEVREAAKVGALILPDVVTFPFRASDGHLPFLPPDAAIVEALEFGQRTSLEFGFSNSLLLFAPIVPSTQPRSHRVLIIPPGLVDSPFDDRSFWQTSFLHHDGSTLIRIPEMGEGLQATKTGLALPLRQTFIQYASGSDPSSRTKPDSFFIIGGDLQAAAWGDPRAAHNTMHYIAAHPWLQPLGTTDLLTGKTQGNVETLTITPPPSVVPYTSQGTPIPSGWNVADLQEMILTALEGELQGVIATYAWQAYLALLTPNPPESLTLPVIRANYFGQIGALLAATDWVNNPKPIRTCSVDPDFDGQSECILASEQIFTLFELDGARLLFAFARDDSGVAQWIAPLSQFYVGGSDPASWFPELGPGSDPNEIPGGFSDNLDRWEPYIATILSDGLSFESADGTRQKIFRLTPRGVQTTYEGPENRQISVQIPLSLTPNFRFTPGWATRYFLKTTPQFVQWHIDLGPSIEIRTTGELLSSPFNASLQGLEYPEDPNYDYPPGHYLPFPLNVVEIRGRGNFEIEINIEY